MSRGRPGLSVRAAEAAYRLALLALPRRFRRESAAEMTATFRHLARRWRGDGLRHVVAGTAAEVWDVALSGARQRMRSGSARVRGGRRSDAAGALGLAVRRVVRKPSYSLAFAGTLGLGLGMAAAMYAIVSAVVLRPSPYADAERIVLVWSADVASGAEVPGSDPATLLAWRGTSEVLDGLEAFHRAPDRVLTGDGAPEPLSATYVTPGLFAFLGAAPVLGRGFLAGEGHGGGARTIVLSHRLWTQRFDRDRAILGRSVEVNGEPFTVVGVMGPGFAFPEEADAWLPVAWSAAAMEAAGVGEGIARLRTGLAVESANERLAAIAARDPTLTPTGRRPVAVTPLSMMTSDRTKLQLLVFFGAVLLVLAIAGANVVSLGLAGAAVRSRELSIQAALGAGRARLVLQLVLEASILAAVGAAFAIVVATVGLQVALPFLDQVMRFEGAGRVPSIWPDGALFAAGAALLVGPLVGVLTAVRGGVGRPSASLSTRAATDERRSVRLQRTLIVAEVALACVLVSGAGLLLNSFLRLTARDAGFDVDRLVTVTLQLPADRYETTEARATFFRRVEEALGALPAVTGVVAVATDFPRSGARFRPRLATRTDESAPRARGTGGVTVERARAMFLPEVTAGPDFHAVVGTRIALGRAFTPADVNTPAVIVNETMARRLWPSGSPIGRELRLSETDEWLTVVGVAADAVQMGFRDDWGEGMEIYRPLDPDDARAERTFVLRTRGSPEALLEPVRAAVWSIDPQQPMNRLGTVGDAMADSLQRERFYLGLLVVFAALATVLAAVGLYAVLAQIVARRTREIGIRVALGARAADVVRTALGVVGLLTGLGVVIGIAASVALTRLLQSLLFGVAPGDPATMAATVLVLAATGMAAALLPTRRALAVHPIRALAAE